MSVEIIFNKYKWIVEKDKIIITKDDKNEKIKRRRKVKKKVNK